MAWPWARLEREVALTSVYTSGESGIDTWGVIRTVLVNHAHSYGCGTRRRLGDTGRTNGLLDAWLPIRDEQNGTYDTGPLAWVTLGCQVSHSSRIIPSFNCPIKCLKLPWCLTPQSPVVPHLSHLQEDDCVQQLYGHLVLHCQKQDGSVVMSMAWGGRRIYLGTGPPTSWLNALGKLLNHATPSSIVKWWYLTVPTLLDCSPPVAHRCSSITHKGSLYQSHKYPVPWEKND